MTTTVIKKGHLLDPRLPFEQGDILIEDDLITQVAPSIDFRADVVIDASDRVVLPGLTSAHTHAFSLPVRGLIDNLPLEPWHLYNKYAGMGKLSIRDLYVSCAICAIEFLKTGTTSLVEHGPRVEYGAVKTGVLDALDNSVDSIANGFLDAGIRAVIAPMYADGKFSDVIPPHLLDNLNPEILATLDPSPPLRTDDIVQALRNLFRHWQDRDSRISLCLGPSDPTISRELMEQTMELASEFDLGIHTHLLETKSDRVGHPSSVVEYLAEINCLGSHVSFAHGVWLDDKDIDTLIETNSSVIHCPISNLKLGSGIAPLQTMKARGLNVALGADNSGGANDAQNMFEVMKYTALIHKLYGPPSKWIGAQDAFAMCLTNGAKVMRKKVGSLQPGYLADLVILGTGRLFITPKENFINQLVYTDLGSSVETVLVGGRIVIEDKKAQMVNEDELYAEAKECAQKLYSDIASLDKRLAPTLDFLNQEWIATADYDLPFTRLARI